MYISCVMECMYFVKEYPAALKDSDVVFLYIAVYLHRNNM